MRIVLPLLGLIAILTTTSIGQEPTEQVTQTQKQKLSALKHLDGNWRGTARIEMRGGKLELTQTERVGPLLGGAVKVIEGRGYDANGETQFNALGIISYDLEKEQMMMRSYAQGRVGDFQIKLTNTGFSWEIPAGNAKIRYVATITDTTWHEVGQRIVDGQEPMNFFEMQLKKVGDTDWPAGNPVSNREE